jgi:hypothetical protein
MAEKYQPLIEKSHRQSRQTQKKRRPVPKPVPAAAAPAPARAVSPVNSRNVNNGTNYLGAECAKRYELLPDKCELVTKCPPGFKRNKKTNRCMRACDPTTEEKVTGRDGKKSVCVKKCGPGMTRDMNRLDDDGRPNKRFHHCFKIGTTSSSEERRNRKSPPIPAPRSPSPSPVAVDNTTYGIPRREKSPSE